MPADTSRSATHLHIDSPGLLSALQDAGRTGLRHLGVPWSGALVPAWQRMANALVDNEPDAPIIESFEGGLTMTVGEAPLRLAVLGAPDLQMLATDEHGKHTLSPMRSHTISAGSTLMLRTTGAWRHAVIAVQALQVASHLGSASTYAKAGLGGLSGQALQCGDELLAAAASNRDELVCDAAVNALLDESTLRVVLGPQQDHFSDSGIDSLLHGEFTLTAEADRMGARLSGPALEHRDIAARDIVSDAIVPGSIQVPGNGQPIVLLNDAHTAGGYPKIGTVISIDLPLLGVHRAGKVFRFEAVTVDEAIDLAREAASRLERQIGSLSAVAHESSLSSEFLLSHNLIGGVIDAYLP